MKYLFYILIATAIISSSSAHTSSVTQFLDHNGLELHYGIYAPQSEPIADVLFFHGYGDNFENHMPLFSEFNRQGLRVIAFDYPSHGKTKGARSDDLNNHTFSSLAELAFLVLEKSASGNERPLILAGWSTGGLLATRMAQRTSLRDQLPNLAGLILYAPGVSVKKCVGNRLCQITNETLTHDKRLKDREISPLSPLSRMKFATNLLFNAHRSWHQAIPKDIPVLLIIGGEEDKYVNSKKVIKWTRKQRMYYGADIFAVQCSGARHELDNETLEYGGAYVREISALFARDIGAERILLPSSSLCPSF